MSRRTLLALVVFCIAQPVQAAEPAPPVPADIEATRQVLAALVDAGKRNRRAARPLDGDALTEYYLSAAAIAARKVPADQAVSAYLAAVGIGLDDTDMVRRNPLFGPFCRRVESDAERQTRLAVLGQPTMRQQRDKCLHFCVSCLLTTLVGPTAAEFAGMLKEQRDMRPGGSGFSFADLAADYAGVDFAVRLRDGRISLDHAARFRVTDFVPPLIDLDDGLTAAQFARKFGAFDDERFAAEVKKVRERIRALPGHQEEK